MADRRKPFDARRDPDSDPPDYEDRPLARPAFVTRREVEIMIERALHPLILKQDRAILLLERAEEERKWRAQWDREQREKEQLEVMRERSRSESDLAQALQRPQTPLVVPVAVPKPPSSSSSLKPHSRTLRWLAVLVPVIVAIIMTIGAVISNSRNPHGGIEPAPAAPHH